MSKRKAHLIEAEDLLTVKEAGHTMQSSANAPQSDSRSGQKGMAILRRPDVQQRTGLGCTSIYNKMRDGTFPKPVKIGERAVGWLEHEIEAWIAGRVKERRRAQFSGDL